MSAERTLALVVRPTLAWVARATPIPHTPEAEAMLLAIGLQESRLTHTRQLFDGPARGYWQFEQTGVRGVLRHPSARPWANTMLDKLNLSWSAPVAVHKALQYCPITACVMARLLLWTLPARLPIADNAGEGWRQYIDAWRPGKPHPETWEGFFHGAWEAAGQ